MKTLIVLLMSLSSITTFASSRPLSEDEQLAISNALGSPAQQQLLSGDDVTLFYNQCLLGGDTVATENMIVCPIEKDILQGFVIYKANLSKGSVVGATILGIQIPQILFNQSI